MAWKQINIRIDDRSDIYRWLKCQDNRTASINSLITSAIEEYGYTDLLKTISMHRVSHNSTISLTRNPDDTQEYKKVEEHKNFSTVSSSSTKAKITLDNSNRHNKHDKNPEVERVSSITQEDLTAEESSNKKDEIKVNPKSVLNNPGLS